MISWIMAMASNPSWPGRIGSHRSALRASWVRTGSMTTSRAPCSFAQWIASAAPRAVLPSFLPQTMISFAFFASGKAMEP